MIIDNTRNKGTCTSRLAMAIGKDKTLKAKVKAKAKASKHSRKQSKEYKIENTCVNGHTAVTTIVITTDCCKKKSNKSAKTSKTSRESKAKNVFKFKPNLAKLEDFSKLPPQDKSGRTESAPVPSRRDRDRAADIDITHLPTPKDYHLFSSDGPDPGQGRDSPIPGIVGHDAVNGDDDAGDGDGDDDADDNPPASHSAIADLFDILNDAGVKTESAEEPPKIPRPPKLPPSTLKRSLRPQGRDSPIPGIVGHDAVNGDDDAGDGDGDDDADDNPPASHSAIADLFDILNDAGVKTESAEEPPKIPRPPKLPPSTLKRSLRPKPSNTINDAQVFDFKGDIKASDVPDRRLRRIRSEKLQYEHEQAVKKQEAEAARFASFLTLYRKSKEAEAREKERAERPRTEEKQAEPKQLPAEIPGPNQRERAKDLIGDSQNRSRASATKKAVAKAKTDGVARDAFGQKIKQGADKLNLAFVDNVERKGREKDEREAVQKAAVQKTSADAKLRKKKEVEKAKEEAAGARRIAAENDNAARISQTAKDRAKEKEAAEFKENQKSLKETLLFETKSQTKSKPKPKRRLPTDQEQHFLMRKEAVRDNDPEKFEAFKKSLAKFEEKTGKKWLLNSREGEQAKDAKRLEEYFQLLRDPNTKEDKLPRFYRGSGFRFNLGKKLLKRKREKKRKNKQGKGLREMAIEAVAGSILSHEEIDEIANDLEWAQAISMVKNGAMKYEKSKKQRRYQ